MIYKRFTWFYSEEIRFPARSSQYEDGVQCGAYVEHEPEGFVGASSGDYQAFLVEKDPGGCSYQEDNETADFCNEVPS